MAPEEKLRRSVARSLRPRRRPVSTVALCAGRTCGLCRSCTHIQAWSEGKYDGKKLSRRGDTWPTEQTARLRELHGQFDAREISRILSAEFPELPRTRRAVYVHACRQGISLWQPGLSCEEVWKLFGFSGNGPVQHWIEEGLLPSTIYVREKTGLPMVRVQRTDLERFVHEQTWAYDTRRMTPGHALTAVAELAQRADPWLPPVDLARYLDVPTEFVAGWIEMGLVPYRRRYGVRRGHDLLIRARDFPSLSQVLPLNKQRVLRRLAL